MNKQIPEQRSNDDGLLENEAVQSKNLAASLRLLGLSIRAGKAAAGHDVAVKQMRLGRAKLLWLAADAAEATQKKLADAAAAHQVPMVCRGSKAELGHWTGRIDCAGVVIHDENFAEQIKRLLDLKIS